MGTKLQPKQVAAQIVADSSQVTLAVNVVNAMQRSLDTLFIESAVQKKQIDMLETRLEKSLAVNTQNGVQIGKLKTSFDRFKGEDLKIKMSHATADMFKILEKSSAAELRLVEEQLKQDLGFFEERLEGGKKLLLSHVDKQRKDFKKDLGLLKEKLKEGKKLFINKTKKVKTLFSDVNKHKEMVFSKFQQITTDLDDLKWDESVSTDIVYLKKTLAETSTYLNGKHHRDEERLSGIHNDVKTQLAKHSDEYDKQWATMFKEAFIELKEMTWTEVRCAVQNLKSALFDHFDNRYLRLEEIGKED